MIILNVQAFFIEFYFVLSRIIIIIWFFLLFNVVMVLISQGFSAIVTFHQVRVLVVAWKMTILECGKIILGLIDLLNNASKLKFSRFVCDDLIKLPIKLFWLIA